jgi:Ni,Fe-hydrogenase III component G
MVSQTAQLTLDQDLKPGFERHGMTLEELRADMLIASVSKEHLPEAVQHIRDDLRGRFISSVGADTRTLHGSFEVTQLFALDTEKKFLLLSTRVSPEDPTIPSVTPLIPGAGWAEREVRDLIGVTPTGHPDLRRLVLPDDWPNDVYPLRKEFEVTERPQAVKENKVQLNSPPEGASVLPIGPFFPTLEEPVFINLFVHGEEIVGMDYRGFYGHRGIEKLADSELTYQQVPHLAERICGI